MVEVASRGGGAERVSDIARRVFGYESLRPGQLAAIRAVLAGRDTLAVLPSGGGKSAIYQIAGLMIPGTTVVVSPLIALQRDQADSIAALQQEKPVTLNSLASTRERADDLGDVAGGRAEFVLLAPEQLANAEVIASLKESDVSLFVVDEAHCISEWGHDFRPEYLELGNVIEALGHPAVLALTATASLPVRREIVERLRLQDPAIIVRGFDRPNIFLGSVTVEDANLKDRKLLEAVRDLPRPGIIYVSTRKRAEELQTTLSEEGVTSAFYHAGMPAKARHAAQEAFMQDEIDVIVATKAFGMGVDKPATRFVIHYNVSSSIDAYYQEIGRAGRDGEPATALLLYDPGDLNLHRFFAGSGTKSAEQAELVMVALGTGPRTAEELEEGTHLSRRGLSRALNLLEDQGSVDRGRKRVRAIAVSIDDAVADVGEAIENHRQMERSRIEMMRRYAETSECRRRLLLGYFGEEIEDCGNCDNCRDGSTSPNDAQTAEADDEYAINREVLHSELGKGVVLSREGDRLTILFEDGGYKVIDLPLALEKDLLHEVKV